MAELPAATAPNTCQYTLHTRRGEYLIQKSWPLSWNTDRNSPTNDPVPAIYIVDGNAYFFSSTEIVRRNTRLRKNSAIVVAIGYVLSISVLSARRSADLTPPSNTYAPVLERDGKPFEAEWGGAKDFPNIITEHIMPFVSNEVFPGVSLGPHALFGHSYGGLFTMYTLFTRADLFDTFMVASPSIWWNKKRITDLEEEFRAKHQESRKGDAAEAAPQPQLFVMYGSDEQFPRKTHHESEEKFNRRARHAAERGMKDNALEVCRRLRDSERLRKVWVQEFTDEDHGGAALCALSRGISRFLECCKDEWE